MALRRGACLAAIGLLIPRDPHSQRSAGPNRCIAMIYYHLLQKEALISISRAGKVCRTRHSDEMAVTLNEKLLRHFFPHDRHHMDGFAEAVQGHITPSSQI